MAVRPRPSLARTDFLISHGLERHAMIPTAPHTGNRGEIVIYQAAEGAPRLEVRLERDTIWLDAHQMASLFERDRTVILRHIRNIYATGELSSESTCAKYAQVAADGRLRQMDLYNLDIVISVGYRVNSRRGTQFRI